MTSARPYRPTISVDAALAELNRHAGTRFDASIAQAFASATSLHHGSADEPHANAASA
jgi:HD-GYP domain-containing protein (c-di-GMP phosphodiesterase class II)